MSLIQTSWLPPGPLPNEGSYTTSSTTSISCCYTTSISCSYTTSTSCSYTTSASCSYTTSSTTSSSCACTPAGDLAGLLVKSGVKWRCSPLLKIAMHSYKNKMERGKCPMHTQTKILKYFWGRGIYLFVFTLLLPYLPRTSYNSMVLPFFLSIPL